MPKLRMLVAAVVLVCAKSACADQPQVTCDKVAGMIAGPIVPTEEVAKEIYVAVARGRGDKIDSEDLIKVKDDGDHWSVFQWSSDAYSGSRGGGMLEMTIAKCDGSILAHYSK